MELTVAIDQLNEAPIRELTGSINQRTTGSVHPFGARMAFRDGATPTLVSANGTQWRIRRRSSVSVDILRHKVRTNQAVQLKASRVTKGDVFLIVDGAEVPLTPITDRETSHSFRSIFRNFRRPLQQLVAVVH